MKLNNEVRGADLLSVQRRPHSDVSAAGVDAELLRGVSAHDGVAQQVVDGAVVVGGRDLQGDMRHDGEQAHDALLHDNTTSLQYSTCPGFSGFERCYK